MTDPEILETRFPVRLERFEIRRGSGGAGKWTGGNGVIRRLRFLDDVTVTTLSCHRITRAHGKHGGEDGAPGVDDVLRLDGTRQRLKGNDEADLVAGEAIEMQTPAGGGWGVPEG